MNPCAERQRYVVRFDLGRDYGWVVDWTAYLKMPWWKILGFGKKRYIVFSGSREAIWAKAAELNASAS